MKQLPHRIPQFLRQLYGRLLYRLDNFFLKGVPAQFTVLFGLMLGLILLGVIGLPLGLYSERNKDVASIGHKMGEGVWDAIWWSTMHIFDPSYVSQDYGATTPVLVLALVIGLLGYVMFGGVIGLVSAAVERKLQSLARGDRPVRESGHLLILGWNDTIFSLLDQFEDYGRDLVVVILANHTVADMHSWLRTKRGRIGRLRAILRTGSPNVLRELERVTFRSAYSIIVLADESAGGNRDDLDIGTIKTIMLLADTLPATPPRPKVVAELVRHENMEVARIAGRHGISLICSGDVLSRMLVQSTRQPGLAYVYTALFGFAGNSLYVQEHRSACHRRFGDVLFEFPAAIPIGTSGMELRDGQPHFLQRLNPGKDHIIAESEQLILLGPGSGITHVASPASSSETEHVVLESRKFGQEKILILGWNRSLLTVLHEYDSFLAAGSEIMIAALLPAEEAAHRLADQRGEPLRNARPAYVCVDYTLKHRLEPLLAAGYSACVVLADESSGEPDPDSRVIMAVLLIHDYLVRHPEKKFKQLVAEVFSPVNADLLRRNCQTDVIVSPRLAAMMIAQVSQQLMLERIYSDLMNANVNEIYLRPAARYTRHPQRCTFADLQRGALRVGQIAIGIKLAAEAGNPASGHGVRLNPPKDEPLALAENDEVIVISHAVTSAPSS